MDPFEINFPFDKSIQKLTMFNFKVWKPFKTTTAILLEGSQHSTNSSATTSQRKKPMSKINGSTFPCLSNMTNPVAGPSTLTCYQYTNISLHEWKVTSYAFISHMPYSKYIIYPPTPSFQGERAKEVTLIVIFWVVSRCVRGWFAVAEAATLDEMHLDPSSPDAVWSLPWQCNNFFF